MAAAGATNAEIHADTGNFKGFAAARMGFFVFDPVADV